MDIPPDVAVEVAEFGDEFDRAVFRFTSHVFRYLFPSPFLRPPRMAIGIRQFDALYFLAERHGVRYVRRTDVAGKYVNIVEQTPGLDMKAELIAYRNRTFATTTFFVNARTCADGIKGTGRQLKFGKVRET